MLGALVALGVALRVYQWAADGTFWLDEISLARNILGRSLGELLFHPLALDQVAPPGFLAVEKLSALVLGESERSLWLFPLVVGIASVFLFRVLAQRTLRGIAVPVAVALFALAVSLIRYSAELKQYGIDAAAAVGLTIVAIDLKEHERPARVLYLAGLAGLVIILFSQASVLVMAGLGAAFAVAAVRERDRRSLRILAITVPIWAIASVIAVVLGERSMTPSTRAFMSDFWRGGFLPRPIRPWTAVPWLWERLEGLFSDPWTLQYPFARGAAVLAVIGIVVLWRRDRSIAMFVAGPFVMTVLAAIAQRYPFRQRLVVFLVPAALVAVAAGVGWLADAAARRSRLAAGVVVAVALVPAVMALARSGLPTRVDYYRPIYEMLMREHRPGDAIHVSFLAYNSALFYGPRYGFAPGDFRRAICDRDDTRAYLRDLDRYRGRNRLWIVFRTGPAYRVPEEAMRRYLATIAIRRQAISVPSGVGQPLALALYDLSDPARLQSASAETFPVPPMPAYPKPGCRDWGGDVRPTLAIP